MSTTASESVALEYAHGASDAPRTVLSAYMSATSRGAYVGWLSQYPDEAEFLFSPLCCLEVAHGTKPAKRDGVLRFAMIFTQNSQHCDPLPPTMPGIIVVSCPEYGTKNLDGSGPYNEVRVHPTVHAHFHPCVPVRTLYLVPPRMQRPPLPL